MSGSDRRRKLPTVLGLLPSAWQHEPPSEPPLGTPAGPPCPATSGHFTRTTTKSQPHRPRIPRLVVSGLYPQWGDDVCLAVRWAGAATASEAHEPDGEIPGNPPQTGDLRRRVRRGWVRPGPARHAYAGRQDHGAAAGSGIGGHRVVSGLPA